MFVIVSTAFYSTHYLHVFHDLFSQFMDLIILL